MDKFDLRALSFGLACALTVGCAVPCMADEEPTVADLPTLEATDFNSIYEAQSPEQFLASSDWLQSALSGVNIEGIDTSKFNIVLEDTNADVLTKQYAQACEMLNEKGFGEEYSVQLPEVQQSSINAKELFSQTYGNLYEENKLKPAEIPADFNTQSAMAGFLTQRDQAYNETVNNPDSAFNKVANQISIGVSAYQTALTTSVPGMLSESNMRDMLSEMSAGSKQSVMEQFNSAVADAPSNMHNKAQALASIAGIDTSYDAKAAYQNDINSMFDNLITIQTSSSGGAATDTYILTDKNGNTLSEADSQLIIQNTIKDMATVPTPPSTPFARVKSGVISKGYADEISKGHADENNEDALNALKSGKTYYSYSDIEAALEKKGEYTINKSATMFNISQKQQQVLSNTGVDNLSQNDQNLNHSGNNTVIESNMAKSTVYKDLYNKGYTATYLNNVMLMTRDEIKNLEGNFDRSEDQENTDELNNLELLYYYRMPYVTVEDIISLRETDSNITDVSDDMIYGKDK